MSEFYRFAGDHPVLVVVLVCLFMSFPVTLVKAIKKPSKPKTKAQ